MKSEAPQNSPKNFTIFRTPALIFPLYFQLFSNLHWKTGDGLFRRVLNLEQVRDSLLKVDITSSELRTNSIMIFSTISCGNLLHAFELMSVCASM